MEKLKIGIVGTGGICRACHVPSWRKLANEVEIYALCDVVEEKAQHLASELGVKHVYKDYRDLIALPEIDIVDICTPNYWHSIVAVDALNAGKKVLCEKPDAVNPAEAKRMLDASRTTGNLLMTIRNNRFSGHAHFMRKFIEDGNMGEIYTVRCGWIRRRGIPGKGGWFTTKALSGGGPLIDLGVHFIDVTLWLMGNPKPVSVMGATYRKFAEADTQSDSVHSMFGERKEDGTFDVEDLATGFARFDNGATMSLEFSWASNIEREDAFYELRGTKAGASYHTSTGQLKIFGEYASRTIDIVPNTEHIDGHSTQIRHFVDCILRGEKPIVTPEQGLDMIKLLDAIYRSAESGHEVVI